VLESLSWIGEQNGPFFVYDRSQLLANADRLRKTWAAMNTRKFKLFYSIKANPNPYIIQALSSAVDGFDVSSLGELKHLLNLKIDPKRITVSGPAKSDRFIKEILRTHVAAVHLDSEEEYEAFAGAEIPLSLRYGGPVSAKLGFSSEALTSLIERSPEGAFAGLHYYGGSETFSGPVVEKNIKCLAEFRKNLEKHFSDDFQIFFGPGFSNWTVLEKQNLWTETPEPMSFPVHIEAGRALAGTAGYYFAPVLSVKNNLLGRRLVLVEGGVQHIAGGVMSPAHGASGIKCEVFRNGNVLLENKIESAIYGSLGLSHDCLHSQVLLPQDLRRGDWLMLHPYGAYGLTFSANQFIAPHWPLELMVESMTKNQRPSVVSPTHFKSYHSSFWAD
jgi:diaminopimelate decarboxylase